MPQTSSKFFQMPAAVPWPALSNAVFSAVGDVDGDGRQELVALNFNQNSSFFSTISHLKRTELTPLWKPATQPDWGQLVLMDTRINWLGQWYFDVVDSFLMADLDGDGADEIFVFDRSQWAGVFEWSLSGEGATQVWDVSQTWIQQTSISGPAGTWNFQRSDTFVAADVDGDDAQEIVVWDAQAYLGVLKWNGSALSLVNICNPAVPAGPGATPWYLFPNDRFFMAKTGGQQRIVAFDGHQWFGVFDWNGSGLQVLWSTSSPLPSSPPASWTVSASDLFFPADLDGDGDQEILIFDGSSSLGVVKWTGSEFSVLFSGSQLPSPDGSQWTFAAGNRFYVTSVEGGDLVNVFDGYNLGSLTWFAGALQVSAVVEGLAPPIVAGENSWNFSPGDQIVPGNFAGGPVGQLFVFDGSSNVGLIQFGQIASWTAGQVPAWNYDFLMASPPSPLVPFQGDQHAVYQYMSNAVYSPSDYDIRSEYAGLNLSNGDFLTFSKDLAAMANPPGPRVLRQRLDRRAVGAGAGTPGCRRN
jgi:hypothetical protein